MKNYVVWKFATINSNMEQLSLFLVKYDLLTILVDAGLYIV